MTLVRHKAVAPRSSPRVRRSRGAPPPPRVRRAHLADDGGARRHPLPRAAGLDRSSGTRRRCCPGDPAGRAAQHGRHGRVTGTACRSSGTRRIGSNPDSAGGSAPLRAEARGAAPASRERRQALRERSDRREPARRARHHHACSGPDQADVAEQTAPADERYFQQAIALDPTNARRSRTSSSSSASSGRARAGIGKDAHAGFGFGRGHGRRVSATGTDAVALFAASRSSRRSARSSRSRPSLPLAALLVTERAAGRVARVLAVPVPRRPRPPLTPAGRRQSRRTAAPAARRSAGFYLLVPLEVFQARLELRMANRSPMATSRTGPAVLRASRQPAAAAVAAADKAQADRVAAGGMSGVDCGGHGGWGLGAGGVGSGEWAVGSGQWAVGSGEKRGKGGGGSFQLLAFGSPGFFLPASLIPNP